jgi:3-hydroxyisobutyrate dehydrogenase-like beta-hydroxyacid dehydrogenase
VGRDDPEDHTMTAPDGGVAFAGLGRMGRPMAARLAGAGVPVVAWNRTRAAAESLAAEHPLVTVADTPRQAAGRASVVITMLADEAAVRAVYTGPDGLAAGWAPGKTAIDMGTTGPDGTAWLSGLVGEAGGVLVDAPVSGSTAAATAGTLTILAGGPDQAVQAVRPVLEAMGKPVYHLGGTGTGTAMKLAVNAVIFGLTQSVAESLVLAERSGIPREQAYDVFCHSAVAAPMLGYRADNFLDPDGTPVSFALRLAAKDLRLITELAAQLAAPMPQAGLNLEVTEQAVRGGLAGHDLAALAVHLRAQAEQARERVHDAAAETEEPACPTSQ